MRRREYLDYVLILLSFVFQLGSVVLGKFASLSISHFDAAGVLLNPFYLSSLGCLGLQAITWPLVLRRLPLFYSYLLMSAIYPGIMAVSVAIFREKVTPMNYIGSILIMAGILLFVSGRKEARANA